MSKRLSGGVISALLMLIFLLSPVRLLAQSDVKVIFNPADNSLTFQKGGAVPEGATVYALNEGQSEPNWLAQKRNITKVVFDPSFDAVRPTSCCSWFRGFIKLTELQGLEYLHTDAVEYMNYMFSDCYRLPSLDVSHFNTSNVTNMSGLFYRCYSLPSLDLRNFDTSNVTDMSDMFNQNGGFLQKKLKSIDVSSFNTSKVTNMSGMFSNCYLLETLDVSNFDTKEVTDMNKMFNACYSLTELNVAGFNTSKVTNMSGMFYGCSKITSFDLRNFDTSQVTNMSNMFSTCSELTHLDVTSFNTSNVTDMSKMFYSCKKLPSLDIRNFDTSNVKNMYNMFANCYALSTIDVSHFNTSNVEDMASLFYNCTSLKELDLSNFDTSKTHVTKEDPRYYGMEAMFEYCNNLETIYVGDKFVITGEYGWMFGYCEKLFGAVGYDKNKKGSDMANNQTGYLKKYKKYGEHKSEKVELYGNKAHYLRNHTYEWATMCLPFAFATDENAAFRFYALKGIEGNSLSVSPLTGTIAAGTPVFVRGANTAGNKIEIVGIDDVLVNVAQTQTTTTANLVGTFADKTDLAADNYIILKDNFWLADELLKGRPGSSVNINALRAHITPAAPLRAAVLTISAEGEGTVTGIDAINGDVNSANGAETFDLQGRRIDSLQRGVNIVRIGGKTKKIVVK